MKKITTLICFLLMGSTYAQSITITQNNNPNLVNFESAVCLEFPEDEEDGLLDSVYYENHFARAFDLQNDHGIEQDFNITSVSFGQGFGRNIVVELNIYTANTDDLTDPNLELNLLQSTNVPIFQANNGEILFINTQATIPAGDILVVEIFGPASGEATNEQFFMGINDEGQTKPSYIKAPECDVEAFMDTANLTGFTNQNYVMSVTGEETLSVNQAMLEKINIYPNPAKDIVNFNLPSNLVLKNARLTDMSGREIKVNVSNKTLDVTDLTTGQYILTLHTNAGTYVHKLLKI